MTWSDAKVAQGPQVASSKEVFLSLDVQPYSVTKSTHSDQ